MEYENDLSYDLKQLIKHETLQLYSVARTFYYEKRSNFY